MCSWISFIGVGLLEVNIAIEHRFYSSIDWSVMSATVLTTRVDALKRARSKDCCDLRSASKRLLRLHGGQRKYIVPNLRETSSSLDAEMTPKTKQEKMVKGAYKLFLTLVSIEPIPWKLHFPSCFSLSQPPGVLT
jgi:hypothetical protein